MTLKIHSPNADALAQKLAEATGEDVDTAVIRAIEERLARLPRLRPTCRDGDIDALFDRLTQMPILDSRSPDDIVGYAPNGLPS